ncbi:hypothetical protein [Mycolicibacterium sphagni]|uniref:Uncharacterized protein n=1 Tax=Mycolicibacterium sphagni TaxID=1786 RepID=A0ABX2JXZ9_9MYCO|nr:hypothetical protein [Mycolicibacterium sphagni]NTY62604.1 hypothetical protein [Mycolicibacterium sphagni]
MSGTGDLRGISGLVVADLTLRRGWGDPIKHLVQPLTANFALCPGLDYDHHTGRWSYVSRWWFLCHIWVGEYGNLEGRDFMVVGQELPVEPGVVGRPALALDLEVCQLFAEWLEQQYDWSSRVASLKYELYHPAVGEEMRRFQDSPNLWEPPVRELGAASSSAEVGSVGELSAGPRDRQQVADEPPTRRSPCDR